ncbi:MAG: hypothetical protein ACRDU8_01350, partial [Egibacteraceae bacterium]
DYAVAAIHLGGLDFHGVVSPYPGDAAYAEATRRLWSAFPTAPVARLLRLVGDVLEGEEFTLAQALPDGRQEIVAAVFAELHDRFGEQYARLYHDHQRTLEMLTEAGYTLPRDLRAAAELTLSARLERQLAESVPGNETAPFDALGRILDLARAQRYELDLQPVSTALTTAVTDATATAVAGLQTGDAQAVGRWVALGGELDVDVDLSGAQELVWDVAVKARAGRLGPAEAEAVATLCTALGFSPVAWSATADSG